MSFFATSEFTFLYLSVTLEGFLYGFYSGIFVLYLQHQASKEWTDNAKNVVFYAICALYLLSTGLIVSDTLLLVIEPVAPEVGSMAIFPLYIAGSIFFGCCDFIAQSIIIYRCWIVWQKNVLVVIIPSILAIAFLAMWIAGNTGQFVEQGQITATAWSITLNITGLIVSMSVNALVTGLIVIRIFKVFREVKANSDNMHLNSSGGTNLRSIIFIIIESGMALLSIQVARLVVVTVMTEATYDAFHLIANIHQMLNGITPTIILVRVSMGLSFYDEASLVEAAESVLRFAPDDPNPNSETGRISCEGSLRSAPDHPNSISEMGNINEEGRDDDIGGNDAIQIVDR